MAPDCRQSTSESPMSRQFGSATMVRHIALSPQPSLAQFAKADDPWGWEVVVPRRIEASEIHKTRRLPQVIGWRFFPKAKGKPPFCTCKFCNSGEYGSAKLRRRLGSPADK